METFFTSAVLFSAQLLLFDKVQILIGTTVAAHVDSRVGIPVLNFSCNLFHALDFVFYSLYQMLKENVQKCRNCMHI
jgi:hypothetical protein